MQDWLQLWQVQAPLLETALTQRLLAHHLRVPLQVLKCWQYQVEVLLHCQLGLSQGQLHWPRQLPHQSWKEQGLVHWSLGMLQLSLGPGQEQCWDWLLGLGLVHSQQELVLELLRQGQVQGRFEMGQGREHQWRELVLEWLNWLVLGLEQTRHRHLVLALGPRLLKVRGQDWGYLDLGMALPHFAVAQAQGQLHPVVGLGQGQMRCGWMLTVQGLVQPPHRVRGLVQ